MESLLANYVNSPPQETVWQFSINPLNTKGETSQQQSKVGKIFILMAGDGEGNTLSQTWGCFSQDVAHLRHRWTTPSILMKYISQGDPKDLDVTYIWNDDMC